MRLALPFAGLRPRVDSHVAGWAVGLCACLAVAGAAIVLQGIEQQAFHRAWLESVALAIVIGAGVRLLWTPGPNSRRGVRFGAKTLLEIAVVLLGASISAAMLAALGPWLVAGIVAVVTITIGLSYAFGRILGLGHRMAVLVACGNSICGNSAIAAVAPVIGAESEEVAATIAFTAVAGVVMVLLLPLFGRSVGMTGLQYGALAGLTVYAVPQVLAATAPMGASAIQFGAIVKLTRVLMLGPVSFVLSWHTARARQCERQGKPKSLSLAQAIPWFIFGFGGLIVARSLGLVPPAVLPFLAGAAGALTVISMAALGLETDLRAVARSGFKVAAAASLSLVILGAISLALIYGLRV